MKKNLLVAASIAVTAMLSACAPLSQTTTTISTNSNQASDAKAKVYVREVVNPADIPAPFTGCKGSHNVDGVAVLSDEGPTYAVTERNKRSCPDVLLN